MSGGYELDLSRSPEQVLELFEGSVVHSHFHSLHLAHLRSHLLHECDLDLILNLAFLFVNVVVAWKSNIDRDCSVRMSPATH